MSDAKNPAPDNAEPGAGGTFFSHLLELRNRLLYALVAVGVVFLALVPFANDVYALIAKPLIDVLPQGTSMIATEVASPFLTPLKLTLAVAVAVAIPFLLYQLWAFVAPGLYRHERRLVLPLLASSTILFYSGMAFAYFVVFPMAFYFLVHAAPPGVQVMTDIKSYMDFIFSMFFAFGIAFEVPVAVVLLSWMGVIDPDQIAKKRPYVVLWAFIVAAVLTPPDVFSQIALAVPMIILFEVGLFVARRLKRLRSAEDAGAGAPAMSAQETMEVEIKRQLEAPVRRRKKRRE